MKPFHYWGVKAIAERIGLKSYKGFYAAYERDGLPAFKRVDPGSNHFKAVWYSNETMISTWELARAKIHREHWLEKRIHRRS